MAQASPHLHLHTKTHFTSFHPFHMNPKAKLACQPISQEKKNALEPFIRPQK
jgi:hypothetical protein